MILVEVGAEKFHYLTGIGIAVNGRGEVRSVNLLDEIESIARDMGECTLPEY